MTDRAKLRADRRPKRSGRLPATCLAFGIAAAVCGRADAQTGPDAAAAARVHLGPLAVSPTLSILNVGRDSNVFNEPDNPRDDLTATLAPSIDLWLRAGRAQIAGRSRLDAILFKQYSDQSTVNTANSGRLDFALGRFRPYASAAFLRAKERPDAIIDTRVQRIEHAASVGTSVTLSPKTAASVYVDRTVVSFAETGSVVAPILRQELNRLLQVRGGAFEYQLTPLTRARVDVQQEQVRFKYASDRDASGIRVNPSVEFKPSALVSGQVRVGLLDYRPADPRIPRFTGPTAAVSVRSIVGGDNEITAGVNRDLFYSVDTQGYYVQTAVTGAVTRQLNERWAVNANVSRLSLAYSTATSSRLPAPIPPLDAGGAPGTDGISALVATRPDTVFGVGAGLGCRLTRSAQAAFSVTFLHRDAQLESGRYDNLRVFGSVIYAVR